jgi:hypothetical protein
MSTVGDVAKIACRLSRNDPDKDPISYAEACDHVADAARFICGSDDPWDFLQMSAQFHTIAGADLYLLADLAANVNVQGIKRILSIVNDEAGGAPLVPKHWMVLERMAGSTQAGDTGAPVAWAPVGTNAIRLWPVPAGDQLLGFLFELKQGDMQPETELIIPEGYASPVLATWAAARMWEQHAGPESRMMADRLDRRHDQAAAKMRDAHGTVRWPYLTFAEPGFYADPQVAILGGSYQGTVG